MPSFCITAPRFTADDVLREKKQLSKEELLAIDRDLRGPNHDNNNNNNNNDNSDSKTTDSTNSNLSSTVIQQQEEGVAAETKVTIDDVYNEINNNIEIYNKQSYMKAIEICPELVQIESNPIRFLRCENYNVTAAAVRLVKYWDMRVMIFGNIRAYKPMNMTGYGTLTDDDINKLNYNPLMLLPKDSLGRTVIYHNKPRVEHFDDCRNAMLRLFFYIISVALEDELSHHNGFIYIADNRETTLTSFDRKYLRYMSDLVKYALPVKPKAYHILTPRVPFINDYIYPIMMHLMGTTARQRFVFHYRDNEFINELKEYSIYPITIPEHLGGTFNTFDEWKKNRLQYELQQQQQLSSSILRQECSNSNNNITEKTCSRCSSSNELSSDKTEQAEAL